MITIGAIASRQPASIQTINSVALRTSLYRYKEMLDAIASIFREIVFGSEKYMEDT